MPRGGKRDGAGRKYTVSPELEFLIREDFARLAWAQRLEQASQIANRAAGVVWEEDRKPNPVSQVPLKDRATVSKYGSLEPEAKLPDDLSDEAWHAIQVIRENKKKLQGKPLNYEVPLPGLYRGRQAIIKEIAVSRGVSVRTVRSILEDK
jgi:hypothetical protein